jgi:hypothetical protein
MAVPNPAVKSASANPGTYANRIASHLYKHVAWGFGGVEGGGAAGGGGWRMAGR